MLTPSRVTRRYVGLTALRWLPTGITAPVAVLLATSRGLSPTQVGLVLATYGTVIALLELPTGGLADALGRRAVLVAGSLVSAAGVLTLAVADSLAGFAVAYSLIGTGRALDSGPLEAWYVDTLAALDRGADPTRGLGRAAAADGLALAVGAVLGGALPALLGDRLAAPVLLAAGLWVAHALAVGILVASVAPRARRSPRAAVRAGLADLPGTLGGALRLAGTDRSVRLLLASAVSTGLLLATLELVGPLRFAALAGGSAEGSRAYGIVMAVAFAAAAAGSGSATWIRDRAGGRTPATLVVLALVGAAAMAAVAVAPTVVLTGAAFAAVYAANGATWPLRSRLLHDRVTAARRATLLSASSLMLQFGAIGGTLVVSRVYEAAGAGPALGVGALALLGAAGLFAALRRCGQPAVDVPRGG